LQSIVNKRLYGGEGNHLQLPTALMFSFSRVGSSSGAF